jgi:hypothetical protein
LVRYVGQRSRNKVMLIPGHNMFHI